MKIEKILDGKKAIVSQGNVSVKVDVSLLENPEPGDHVIVHAGFAIETLSSPRPKSGSSCFAGWRS